METINIYGTNRFETFSKIREACRGIVISEDKILLTYEVNTDQYFLPGGGLEQGETLAECCIRELAEETGYQVEPRYQYLTINEYYEEWKFISHYFVCAVAGKTSQKLTEREAEVGLEPRWVPLEEAVEIFSKHNEYADNEMKRGAYQREHEALLYFLRNRVEIEEIPVERVDEFWDIHFPYCVLDISTKLYEAELTDELLSILIAMSAAWESENSTYGYRTNDRSDIEENRIFLAERNGEVLGYLFGHKTAAERTNSIMEEGTAFFEIEELYVVPEHRSEGIGKKLFSYAEQTVQAEGIGYLMLSTATKDCKRILHFYLDELGMDFWSARLFKKL